VACPAEHARTRRYAQVVKAQWVYSCSLHGAVPGFGRRRCHGLAAKRENPFSVLADLRVQNGHGFAIEWHRDRASRLGLVGMNPRHPTNEIDLIPLHARDVESVAWGGVFSWRAIAARCRSRRGKNSLRSIGARNTPRLPRAQRQPWVRGTTLLPIAAYHDASAIEFVR
jgi:hypothetical protein